MKFRGTFFLYTVLFLLILPTYCFSQAHQAIQEPKGTTMDLVLFKPQMIKFPFEIKYPSQWYATEVAAGVPILILSREPIRKQGDEFKVGVSLYYMVNHFVRRLPSDSDLGKMAETVIAVKDWGDEKKRLVQGLQQQSGIRILSELDTSLSGCQAIRVDYQIGSPADTLRVVAYYVKVDNNLLMYTYEAPLREFEKYKEAFEAVTASFKFTE